MIRAFSIAVAAVVAAVCLAGTVSAITLTRGTYKLQWRIPGPEGSALGVHFSLRYVSAGESARLKGVCSTKALIRELDDWTVIVDESAGTGTGYDVGYVLPASQAKGTVELSKACRLPLSRNASGELVSDRAHRCLMDWIVGDKERHITNKVAVGLSVFPRDSLSGPGPWVGSGSISRWGGWFGKIQTDEGKVDIALRDNGKHVYGEPQLLKNGRIAGYPVTVSIGERTGQPEDMNRILKVGHAVPLDGKLYVLKPSAAGDSLSIQPYTGPSGVLRLSVRDVFGKGDRCLAVELEEPTGRRLAHVGTEVRLPKGEYTCKSATVAVDSQAVRRIVVRPNRKISIADDKTTSVFLHGPLIIKLGLWPDVATFRVGDRFGMYMTFALGGDPVDWPGDLVHVSMLDSKGKVISNCQASRDCGAGIKIPGDCAPGEYTLEARIASSGCSTPALGSRRIQVVE